MEPVNLVGDPSFEQGYSPWLGFGAAILENVTTQPHSGTKCIAATNRVDNFSGPAYPAHLIATEGETYTIGMWLRAETGAHNGELWLKTLCEGSAAIYGAIPGAFSVVDTEWAYIEGSFIVPTCELLELTAYVQGPAINMTLYMDDASLYLVE
jgi:endo-1,4-beta-xylanase